MQDSKTQAIATNDWLDARLDLAVAAPEFYIMSHAGIDYYAVSLRQTDWHYLGNIIQACAAVEAECWKAQEDFYAYLQKCDVLSYAVRNDRLVGFNAASLLHDGAVAIYSNDEAMVALECRGLKLARNLFTLCMDWFYRSSDQLAGTSHLVLLSISCNPRVINGYAKQVYLRCFETSIKATQGLIGHKEAYCRKAGIELVDEAYPFAFKKLFPGSNCFAANDPRYQFSPIVQRHLPPTFDHMVRGDAFGFFVKTPKKLWSLVLHGLMLSFFGRDYHRLYLKRMARLRQ